MYRACSTWQYDILSHLLVSRLAGVRLGFLDGDGFARIASQAPSEGRTSILKSHDAHPAFARELSEGRAAAVYSYRDLRDVAFSYMHKAQLGFEDLVSQRFIPKVIQNDRFWRSQPATLSQRYETILANPTPSIHELAAHIGVSLSGPEADALADEYSWQSNLRRTLEVRRRAEAAGVDLDDRANAYQQDPVTLLHWNHLRVRQSTSWRDISTASQRETLAHLCGDWLIENGYETDSTWVASPTVHSRGNTASPAIGAATAASTTLENVPSSEPPPSLTDWLSAIHADAIGGLEGSE
jgi:hypothetical protein